MNKIFQGLTTDGLAETVDRVGRGNEPFPSNAYEATIKVAYVITAESGAMGVTLVADINGREYRETAYVTKRTGENYFLDKKDPNKKVPLPGFTTMDDICLLTTGEGLTDQEAEEKVVKIYDYEQKKEVPTPVPVLVNLTGKKVILGVLREIVDKQKKDSSGQYINTGETRSQNTIDKVFHAETKRTVVEYKNEILTPEFYATWLKANEGQDRNKASGAKTAGGAGQSGSGRPGLNLGGNAAGAPAKAPARKLFG